MKKYKQINLWLIGGFGNVLFQLFFLEILKKNNYKVTLIDNLTSKNFLTRIIGWKIHSKIYLNFTMSNVVKSKNLIYSIITILMAKIFYKFNIKSNQSFFYNNDYYENIIYSKNIIGYFQNKNFLDDNKIELINFCEKLKNNLNQEFSHDVVVHYRMSDSSWARISESYYSEIKKLLRKEKSIPLVVTDDIFKAKSYFSDLNVNFSKNTNPLDDFKLMVFSKKLYCSPSTFSWWASHMLSNEAEVIFPKFLFQNLGFYKSLAKFKKV